MIVYILTKSNQFILEQYAIIQMMHTPQETSGMRKIDFMGNKLMLLHLSNERIVLVPLDKFQSIAQLTAEERNDFEIIDDQYLSFLAIDEVYSVKELIGIG